MPVILLSIAGRLLAPLGLCLIVLFLAVASGTPGAAPQAVRATGVAPQGTAASDTPSPTLTPCASPIAGAITGSDLLAAGILTSLGTPTTCQPAASCPGGANTLPHHYKAYTFINTSG